MARIIYYAGLDYDLLPTSKKRRVSTPLSETYTKRIGYNAPLESGDTNFASPGRFSVDDTTNSSSITPSQNSTSSSYSYSYGQNSNNRTLNNHVATSSPTPSSASTIIYGGGGGGSAGGGGCSSFCSAAEYSQPSSYDNSSYSNQPTPKPLRPYNQKAQNSGYNSTSTATPSGFYHTNNHKPNPIRCDTRTLHTTLKRYFKFETFRENQLEAVEATCAGLDTLILMPTGGGKSICYQLPAILSDGVSIVVSPLKSLIADQVTRLKSLDIETSALFGDIPQCEVDEIKQDLESRQPRHKLLYVTPEKISASASLMKIFRSLYSRNLLARFVIDEAHCVSMWGSDFRPDYRKLGIFRQEFPAVPIMALTATAPQKVRDDILNQLGMNKTTGRTFIQSFNRPNLKFEVRPKQTKNCHVEICKLIRANFRGQCGIIYCFSRAECETVAEKLRDEGISSAPYHAGLSDAQRDKVFSNWSRGSFQVVCATIAFGMGIDKSDVRFVIHYSLPKSVEGYYQEAGRAGRDGKFASCILFYSKSDCVKMKRMLSKTGFGRKVTDKNRDTGNFQHMIDYCERNECRRSVLLRYLGEDFNRQECIRNLTTACDNCLANRSL